MSYYPIGEVCSNQGLGSVVGIEDQLEVERAIARILGKGYGAHYTILSLQRVVFNGYFLKKC